MGSPGSGRSGKGGYVVLQRFMVDELDLTGDELLAYAIIYGFCQDGVSACRCSRGYFAYWLGKSKTTVNRVLDSLVAKGCIVRAHETADGQIYPRYLLGPSAPAVAVEHELVHGADGGYAHGKGGTPTYPPCHDVGEEMPDGTGGTPTYPPSAGVPGVRGRTQITETEAYSETESDGARAGNPPEPAALLDDFMRLRSFMPSTEGYRYGYDNYRKLRSMGFSAGEIEKAACAMTKAIRADYPERSARYFPHAERLLNPENPQGIGAHLDRRRVDGALRAAAAAKGLPDDKLLIFAMSNHLGQLTREAIALNEAARRAEDPDEREHRRSLLAAWIDDNRDALEKARRAKMGG